MKLQACDSFISSVKMVRIYEILRKCQILIFARLPHDHYEARLMCFRLTSIMFRFNILSTILCSSSLTRVLNLNMNYTHVIIMCGLRYIINIMDDVDFYCSYCGILNISSGIDIGLTRIFCRISLNSLCSMTNEL